MYQYCALREQRAQMFSYSFISALVFSVRTLFLGVTSLSYSTPGRVNISDRYVRSNNCMDPIQKYSRDSDPFRNKFVSQLFRIESTTSVQF